MACLPIVDFANTSKSFYASAGGGGGSLFQSTFTAVPCAGNASTILMSMPAGQFGYNGLFQAIGSGAYLSGTINTAADSIPSYYGNINPGTPNQPPNSAPVDMVINEGDSPLSTIKLIVANNGATAGTFSGIVAKLY